MSEFNELVKAFLLGNNIHFEESEKEPNTLIISEMGKNQGFMPRLFERLKTQKESLKIFLLDGFEENIELNDEADLVIWNDSFSGKNLEERVKNRIAERNESQALAPEKTRFEKKVFEFGSRYLGMGRDILFAKFFGGKRKSELLEVGRVMVTTGGREKAFFCEDSIGKKRFAFILEETGETQYLKGEFNRFMELFCKEESVMSQSLPVYFSSNDFWFGGLIHSQMTNRLNQDLGLFLTEDTVFYMIRLGFIIPFIDEMDLFCSEGYLNPQSAYIGHLFHLCGEKGMFVAGCSWDSVLHEDVRQKENSEKLEMKDENTEWLRTLAKPMGSRILEDEANAKLFGLEAGYDGSVVDDAVKKNEQKLINWIENPEFPILKPGDRKVLIKQVAARWMERGAYYLEIDDFHGILFSFDILPEGKRTLAHIHEIVRAVMNSEILILSDFDQIIPVSRLMGEAVVLWMLEEEFNSKESLEYWLTRHGFNQRIFRKLLKRYTENASKNIITPLSNGALDIINGKSKDSAKLDQKVIENAFDLYIAINNSLPGKECSPISSDKLYDMNMSHEIIKGLKFKKSDMHNILFQQSVFIECQFIECNLTSAYFAGSTFLDCRFEKSDLRNADFSGSNFRSCELEGNAYEDLILIGCLFEDDCNMDLDVSRQGKSKKMKLWLDGSKGIQGQEKKTKYDLQVLGYLLQKEYKFYSRYGFRINPDVGFHHSGKLLGAVSDENFLDFYNYFDVYDELDKRPELFFAKRGSIYHIKKGAKNAQTYRAFKDRNLYIDHVIKYSCSDGRKDKESRTKILYRTSTETFIEESPNEKQWFKNPSLISNRFVGRGVSSVFLDPHKVLAATDIGGLFLFEQKGDGWVNLDGKFQSEPVSKIFSECFENMAFVKRGSSMIEVWDTLNDLSLLGRLVTSFKDILGIRLIENLNHAIIYGEWADGSIGALVYNIINKHLITYWVILSSEEMEKRKNLKSESLEKLFADEVKELLKSLKEKSSREISLSEGVVQKNCKELRWIMDSVEVIHPEELIYMAGEPVAFQWKVRSKNPLNFPIDKTYTDVITGEKVEYEFEIKIGDILSVQSGKLKPEPGEDEISIYWKDESLENLKDSFWGDHKLEFKISLLGEEKREEKIFKIRPGNPFKGGVSISKEMGSDYLFVGRENELEKSLELVKRGESFTVKGARRIGKTSFIHRLRENLPPKVLAAYISFDEFEENTSQSTLMNRIQKRLKLLSDRYPDAYDEFSEDFNSLKNALSVLDFQWLMSRGLEKIKENYPEVVNEIWPELERLQHMGKPSGYIFSKFSSFLKRFDDPPKVVFIVDEIGIASRRDVALNNLFNPFRPIIEKGDIVVILAGIPYNFHELTSELDVQTDSGFMSYVGEHIVLGPLTDDECKHLIRNNLSKRINVEDDVLDYALRLSARRPEDLQIIMHYALKEVSSDTMELDKTLLRIREEHIKKGFDILVERRGYTCSKIWEKVSEIGKKYLNYSSNSNDFETEELKEILFCEISEGNLSKEDIEIFKGYGFTDPNETMLVIPMYFKEWVRQELYTREFKKEDDRDED